MNTDSSPVIVSDAGSTGMKNLTTVWCTISQGRCFITTIRPGLEEWLGHISGAEWSKVSKAPVTLENRGTQFPAWELKVKDASEAKSWVAHLEAKMAADQFRPKGSLGRGR